ncbi:mucin-22-like [Ptychodera flava]|uniref:mucin-22-like n=1 Tax=Ptychodera flava TaxID=63121 RepID=UPI003969F013
MKTLRIFHFVAGMLLWVVTASAQTAASTQTVAFTDQSDGTEISDGTLLVTIAVDASSGPTVKTDRAQLSSKVSTTQQQLPGVGSGQSTGYQSDAASTAAVRVTTASLAKSESSSPGVTTTAQPAVESSRPSSQYATTAAASTERTKTGAVTTAAGATSKLLPQTSQSIPGSTRFIPDQTSQRQRTSMAGGQTTVQVTSKQATTHAISAGDASVSTAVETTAAKFQTSSAAQVSTGPIDASTIAAAPVGVTQQQTTEAATTTPSVAAASTQPSTAAKETQQITERTQTPTEVTTNKVLPPVIATGQSTKQETDAATTAPVDHTTTVPPAVVTTAAPASEQTRASTRATTVIASTEERKLSSQVQSTAAAVAVTTAAAGVSSITTKLATGAASKTAVPGSTAFVPGQTTQQEKTSTAVEHTTMQATSRQSTGAPIVGGDVSVGTAAKTTATEAPTPSTAQVPSKPTDAATTAAAPVQVTIKQTTQVARASATAASSRQPSTAAKETQQPTTRQQTTAERETSSQAVSTQPVVLVTSGATTAKEEVKTTSIAKETTQVRKVSSVAVTTVKVTTETPETTAAPEKTTESAFVPADAVDPKALTKEQNEAVVTVTLADILPEKWNSETWEQLKSLIKKWIQEWMEKQKGRKRRDVTDQPSISPGSSAPTTSSSAEPDVKMVGSPSEDKDSNFHIALLAEDGKGGYVPAKDLAAIITDNKDELESELGVKVVEVSEGMPDSVGSTAKMEDEEGSYFSRNKGVFIALIVLGCICLVVIIVGLLYILCTRRSHGGQHYLHTTDPEVAGVDNPVMVEKVNGANNPQKVDDTEIVPYESFTKEELESYEVEDTHL